MTAGDGAPNGARDPRDVDAWERCTEIVRRRSPADAERINRTLAKEGLAKAGHDAAYRCQYDALKLRPWDMTPSCINPCEIDAMIARGPNDPTPHSDYNAAVLLRKMLAAGISRWEPDPMVALAQAKKKDAAA
jgi:hypothetical protein